MARTGQGDFVDLLIDFAITGDPRLLAAAGVELSFSSTRKAQAQKILEHVLQTAPTARALDKYVGVCTALGDDASAVAWCEKCSDIPEMGVTPLLLRAWLERRKNGLDASVPFYRLVGQSNREMKPAERVGSSYVMASSEVEAFDNDAKIEPKIEWIKKPTKDKDTIAYVCCDTKYLNFLFDGYYASLQLAGISRVHVHAINPSDAIIKHLTEDFPAGAVSLSFEAVKSVFHIPSYVQNMRYAVLKDILSETGGGILTTDVDFRFLTGSDRLIKWCEKETDVAYVAGELTKHKYRHPWDRVFANFVYTNKKAARFVSILSAVMEKYTDSRKNTSHLDQVILESINQYILKKHKNIKSVAINSVHNVDEHYVQATGNGNNPGEKLGRLGKAMNDK